MLLVHLSDFSHKANHFQELLLKSYRLHGGWEQGKDTIPTAKDSKKETQSHVFSIFKKENDKQSNVDTFICH